MDQFLTEVQISVSHTKIIKSQWFSFLGLTDYPGFLWFSATLSTEEIFQQMQPNGWFDVLI
jgi:hypothetical protein